MPKLIFKKSISDDETYCKKFILFILGRIKMSIIKLILINL